jgi:lysyl-tRNA synthetase, class I
LALAVPEIIGRGTWLDKVAQDVLDRERELGRKPLVLRVESGLGASGIPHLGSFADGARAWGVKMALDSAGSRCEYIAFSDDKDGLRRVPAGLPKSLQKYIGFPVSSIPDPFDCHGSYGEHMSLLLLDALDKAGIQYTAQSGAKAYKDGLFNNQIEKILSNAEKVGRIIKDTMGQEKYTEVLPYFPVCANCGRIYTTKALSFDPATHLVRYQCEGMELRGERLKGCGNSGVVDVRKGEGKLSWKVEFAARWSALKINYEAYGKDLTESVMANDRVMEEILGEPAPYHTRYEHFIDKTGAKLSKSTGNVIAPQLWLNYGPPQSLLLLMFKRSVGARAVWLRDVPTYIGELDELEDVYFGRKMVKDSRELAKLRGLYEYCWNMKPPAKASLHVPHNLMVYLAKVAPKGREREFVLEKLAGYGYKLDEVDSRFDERLERAARWAREVEAFVAPDVKVEGAERDAVLKLAGIVSASGDEVYLQNAIFTVAKKHGLEAGKFFKTLYRVLIGSESGPRLGPYIVAMGRENVAAALVRAARQEAA